MKPRRPSADAMKALKKAREGHWTRMHNAPRRCKKDGEAPIADACPLCSTFFLKGCRDRNSHGEICPIARYTGMAGCGHTPYTSAERRWNRYHANPTTENRRLFQAAADREIALLKTVEDFFLG